ncbi:hypothetical protein PJM49_29075, partial [Mycobacterium kansasii]
PPPPPAGHPAPAPTDRPPHGDTLARHDARPLFSSAGSGGAGGNAVLVGNGGAGARTSELQSRRCRSWGGGGYGSTTGGGGG